MPVQRVLQGHATLYMNPKQTALTDERRTAQKATYVEKVLLIRHWHEWSVPQQRVRALQEIEPALHT